jgi:hypothetical protein
MRDTKARVCAVCARVLDYKEPGTAGILGPDHAEEGWLHLHNPDGHLAVPVMPDEVKVNGFCDFCSDPAPSLELPARDFKLPVAAGGTASRGHWSCCGACAVLIEKDEWDRIVERAMQTFARINGVRPNRTARRATEALYDELRKHVTGPVRPLTWPPTRTPDQDR